MQIPETPWKIGQKISFRFFFIFLALTSYVCWNLVIFIVHDALFKGRFDLAEWNKPLTGLFYWLDKHIYHTGLRPHPHDLGLGDNHFGVVWYLTVVLFAVIVTIIWSVLDKKRSTYNKLYYWFSLYLRYVLAIIIFGYGIDKVIPVQMSTPGAVSMTLPYGSFSGFDVLWGFMGVSPGYMIFTGSLEIIAALLLFSRRTAVAGYILTAGIMANVVALNWFYNVPVKLFSIQLLLYTLFLLAPYLKNIFQVFFMNGTADFSRQNFVFKTGKGNYLMRGALIFVPLVLMLIITAGTHKRYVQQQKNARNEKPYEVTAFELKDTTKTPVSDTLRWKRVLMNIYGTSFVIANMKDQLDWYDCDVDSLKKTFTLHDNPDKKTWQIFSYTKPSKEELQLTGQWKGKNIRVLLKPFPLDSMNLSKEKIKLIQ